MAELSPELVNTIAKVVAETVKQVQTPQDEWSVVAEPMKQPIEERNEVEKFIIAPSKSVDEKKELKGFKTDTFLDGLFLDEEQQPLDGIPKCSQIAITGMSGSGKSILIEEIAVRCCANGFKVLYVTGEDAWKTPTNRYDLQSRLMQKAKLLGLDWGKISENLYVLDLITNPELREWKTFAQTYRYACETHGIDLALVDSVTVLETSRFQLKYRVIETVRYNQQKGITALFVNQRTEEKDDISGMSGGYGLDYQYDSTVIIDFTKITNFSPKQMVDDLDAERGEFVRYARVLDNRLCGFDRHYIRLEITQDGFLRRV